MPAKKSKAKAVQRDAKQTSLFSFFQKKKKVQGTNESEKKKPRLEPNFPSTSTCERYDDHDHGINVELQNAITPELKNQPSSLRENDVCMAHRVSPTDMAMSRTESDDEKTSEQIKTDVQESALNETPTKHEDKDAKGTMDDSKNDDGSDVDNDTEKDDSSIKALSENDDETGAQNPEGLSEYELLRQRNIARNNARLAALGLLHSIEEPPKPKKHASKKRPAKPSIQQPSLPTRRSSRLSQAPVLPLPETESAELPMAVEPEVPPEDQYDVSPLVRYEMEAPNASNAFLKYSNPASVPLCDDFNSVALVPLEHRLAAPQGLSAIYALNFYHQTSWIVGAGKSGVIALWNSSDTTRDTTSIDPLVSWKGHGGRWISEAQFLTTATTTLTPSRLLTAANDGSVCLWDLGKVSITSGIPRLLNRSSKSLHSSGIFAMDISRSASIKVATGSKDKTVAISSISDFTPVWRSHVHAGKVGAVRFRDANVFATASDDGCVAVLDDRMQDGDGPPGALLEGLHQGRPHSVVWDPDSPHLLTTAGLDNVIQTFDIRNISNNNETSPEPLAEYHGHVPTTTKRCKRIHHPIFYDCGGNGSFLLTGGEGSHSLSMFQYQPTNVTTIQIRIPVYSRGSLPADCNHADVGSIAVQQEIVAASVEGEVLLLKPGASKPAYK